MKTLLETFGQSTSAGGMVQARYRAMRYFVEINERTVVVDVTCDTASGVWSASADGISTIDVVVLGNNEISVKVGGRLYCVRSSTRGGQWHSVSQAINATEVQVRSEREEILNINKRTEHGSLRISEILAPMPGRIVQVLVQVGDVVESGAALVVIEAMKMENALMSTDSGKVSEVLVTPGQSVESNEILLRMDPL